MHQVGDNGLVVPTGPSRVPRAEQPFERKHARADAVERIRLVSDVAQWLEEVVLEAGAVDAIQRTEIVRRRWIREHGKDVVADTEAVLQSVAVLVKDPRHGLAGIVTARIHGTWCSVEARTHFEQPSAHRRVVGL